MDNTSWQLKLFSELPIDDLIAFNNAMYPHKPKYNAESLIWRFRVGFDPKIEPIYLLIDEKIVGQAGLIPNHIVMKDTHAIAIWFNKFIVSNQLQGQGFGKILTQRWMELTNIHITNCNDQSMQVFKKYGWEEEFSSARFARPIHLKNVAKSKDWKGLKLSIASIATPFYQIMLHGYCLFSKQLQIQSLSKNTAQTLLPYFKQISNNYLVKDEQWIQWRLLSGPLAKEYYIIRYHDAAIIFRHFEYHTSKRIHVVYQTLYSSEQENKILLKSLLQFALKNKVDLIWAFTNIPHLKNSYQHILSNTISTRFAFHTQDPETMSMFHTNPIPLQSVDSDYDSMYV